MFFRLNSLFKIAHLKRFCCQQRATPRITGFKTCPKECNKSRSGHRGSCLGAQIVDLFQVNECQNRDNTTPPTVVNMEPANPLLGQRKIMKNRKKREKTRKKNKEKSKVDISELGTATRSRGRRATEPGLEDLDPTTGSHVPC